MEKNCNTFERKRTGPRNSWLGRSASPGRLCPNGSRALPTPDTEHVVRISQLFGISTDALLLDDAVFPPSAAKAASSRRRWELLIGGLAAGLASTGLLILGICASVFPSVHVETKPDQNWIRVYTGLSGFLLTKNLGWLFCLLCPLLAGGIAALFHPQLERVWKKLRQRFARKGTPFAEE